MALKALRAATLAVAALCIGQPASAQDANAGRKKTELCQTCHGVDGLGRLPDAPHLSGQPAVYLERQLRAFRSGERKSEMMSIVSKMLSDDDIRDLSAHYASIKIEVKVP